MKVGLQAPHMYTSGPVTATLGNSEKKEATEAREPNTAQGRVDNEGEDPYAVGGVCPWWRGRGLSLEQPGALGICFSGAGPKFAATHTRVTLDLAPGQAFSP